MRVPYTWVAPAAVMCAGFMMHVHAWSAATDTYMTAPVVAGERLSAWILRNAGPNHDTTALHWRVEAERAPQTRLKQAIVSALHRPE